MIPAAGRATRLSAATPARPKALISIAGRPLLDRLLETLSKAVEQACVVVGDLEGPIPGELGNERHGIRIRYVAQPEPRGVGDAVLRASAHVHGPFAVAMGDVFYERALDPHLAAWRASGCEGAVLVEPVRQGTTQPVGLVESDEGRLRSIRKGVPEAGQRQGLAGLAVLPGSAFQADGHLLPDESGELELEQIIAWLMAERDASFATVPYEGWRRNINTDEDLQAVTRYVHRKERR